MGTVRERPLSEGASFNRNGTATLAHSPGEGYPDAEPPKQLRNMSVSMMPGLSGTAAMPGGNSCASACVRPSIAHFVAQYGATSAAVERPQLELKFTMTPARRETIAGTKWRMTFATPLRFTPTTRENSSAPISQSFALRLMSPALLSSKSGAPWVSKMLFAQVATCSSEETSTTANWFGAGNRLC